MCIFILTICGFLQWKNLGKAGGVDIKGATGKVPESDLETEYKIVSSRKTHRCSISLHVFWMTVIVFLSSTSHSHGIHRKLFLSEVDQLATCQDFSSE